MLGSISADPQDGSFTIVAVPPGSYLLTGALCGNEPPVSGVQELEVSGNVEGLKLHVTPARQVRGTLKLEGDANLAGATVYLLHAERFPGRAPSVAISSGSSLVFEGALSLHYVPEVRRLPLNCCVKSVRYGGQEVAATGFQPVDGASLEITVSTLGAVGGVVAAADRPRRRAGQAPARRYTGIACGPACHLPRVKSGNFTGMLPLATDSSLMGPGALHAAAS